MFNAKSIILQSARDIKCLFKTIGILKDDTTSLKDDKLVYVPVSGDYLVSASDNQKVLLVDDGANDVDITFPSGLDIYLTVRNKGTGGVNFVASGSTIESTGLILATQYTSAFVEYESTTIVHIEGELT